MAMVESEELSLLELDEFERNCEAWSQEEPGASLPKMGLKILWAFEHLRMSADVDSSGAAKIAQLEKELARVSREMDKLSSEKIQAESALSESTHKLARVESELLRCVEREPPQPAFPRQPPPTLAEVPRPGDDWGMGLVTDVRLEMCSDGGCRTTVTLESERYQIK